MPSVKASIKENTFLLFCSHSYVQNSSILWLHMPSHMAKIWSVQVDWGTNEIRHSLKEVTCHPSRAKQVKVFICLFIWLPTQKQNLTFVQSSHAGRTGTCRIPTSAFTSSMSKTALRDILEQPVPLMGFCSPQATNTSVWPVQHCWACGTAPYI